MYINGFRRNLEDLIMEFQSNPAFFTPWSRASNCTKVIDILDAAKVLIPGHSEYLYNCKKRLLRTRNSEEIIAMLKPIAQWSKNQEQSIVESLNQQIVYKNAEIAELKERIHTLETSIKKI